MVKLTEVDYSVDTRNGFIWLIDVVELALGKEEFVRRYGRTPDESRSSEDHDKSKHMVAWSLVIRENCMNLPEATLTKARIDSFREVISARQNEASQHKKLLNRPHVEESADTRHTYFMSLLKEVLKNLVWAEEQCHPKAPSQRASITMMVTSIEALQVANAGRLDMFSGGNETVLDDDLEADQYGMAAQNEEVKRQQAALREEEERRKQDLIVEERRASLLAFLDNVYHYRAAILDRIQKRADRKISPTVMALLVNFAMCELEVMINQFVLRHFDGDDSKFLLALHTGYEQSMAEIAGCNTVSADEKERMKYDAAQRPFMPATTAIQSLRHTRLRPAKASNRSGLIARVPPVYVGGVQVNQWTELRAYSGTLLWQKDAVTTFCRGWKQLYAKAGATEDQAYQFADYITRCMPSYIASGKALGWQPAAVQVLISATRICIPIKKSHGHILRSTAKDMLVAIQRQPEASDPINRKIFERIISLGKNILQDAAVPQRSAKGGSRTIRPTATYSDINSLVLGDQHLALLHLARKAIWKKEACFSCIYYALHIYNMLRITSDFPYWYDAEYIIARYGCYEIFGQNSRPATLEEALRCLRDTPHLSAHQSFLKPSAAMKAVYKYIKVQSIESARDLSAFSLWLGLQLLHSSYTSSGRKAGRSPASKLCLRHLSRSSVSVL